MTSMDAFVVTHAVTFLVGMKLGHLLYALQRKRQETVPRAHWSRWPVCLVRGHHLVRKWTGTERREYVCLRCDEIQHGTERIYPSWGRAA